MTRVSATPGRDLSKPLVEIPDDVSRSRRFALKTLRWYIGALFVFGVFALIIWTLGLIFLW